MGIYENFRKQATVLESGLAFLATPRLDKDRTHLMMWQPKAKNPFYNYLVKHESVQKVIDDANLRLAKHKEQVIARREKSKATPDKMAQVNIGDIYYTSWGYEQTNIDFYQVISKKGCSVMLCAIASSLIEHDSWASGKVMPIKDKFKGEPFLKRACFNWDGKASFNITSFATAKLWNGEPKNCSWWDSL